MNSTTKQLYPTTQLDLHNPFNFEANETSRTPMATICTDGGNNWPAAFAYIESIGSGRSFKIDSYIVKDQFGEHLEWVLRTFQDPIEDSIRQELDDELNEDIYEEERGM
jgi:hypothetical protein